MAEVQPGKRTRARREHHRTAGLQSRVVTRLLPMVEVLGWVLVGLALLALVAGVVLVLKGGPSVSAISAIVAAMAVFGGMWRLVVRGVLDVLRGEADDEEPPAA